MGRLFGTDGIRGVAGKHPLDADTIWRVGTCLAQLGMRRLVIGRDTRESGPWIESILTQALESQGGEVRHAGVMTTPGVSFLCQSLGCHGGIAVSASHNVYSDNGLKIFRAAGTKLSDQEERSLEDAVEAAPSPPQDLKKQEESFRSDGSAAPFSDSECFDRYLGSLQSISRLESFSPLKVVLDCANGAASGLAPQAFERMGATVIRRNTKPDGRNINQNCGAVHPEAMAKAVGGGGADLGVAFDGDADRCIMSDSTGRIFDGDHLLYILGVHLLKRNELATRCVVTTVMANLGLQFALEEKGIQMVRTQVGDRHVLEEMERGNHPLGGEQSGHIILRRHAKSGDGILTALKIAEIVLEEGRGLEELSSDFELFPQIQCSVPVAEKFDFTTVPEIQREIQEAERSLGERGRVLVRYSGTEPLVRVMVEGEEKDQVEKHAEAIASQFRRGSFHLDET